ncbi:V-type proton ATPase subunit C 1-A-like [Halichondria panicea]|uniref:V-type proton ATPase subunit C 1-A-like n=1 Tax=Halichondria panicea TaxID=6063 RepID=UPI00312B3423
MAAYWLVSAPGDPKPENTWGLIKEKTGGVSVNHKFNIPDLKVGTLDTLVDLGDKLQKLDPFVENVVRKMAQYMGDILEPEDKEKLQENLLVGPAKVPMETFLTRFQWDSAKFPLRQPLPNIVEGISKLVSQVDTDLKTKSQSYNALRQNLQIIERKNTGNLMTRSLVDLVKKEDFVLDSEYLQTLIVVVPKSLYKEWENSYEKITQMVVPRSTKKVADDSEYGLYTVTVFRKVADEYKHHAREKKFIVREFDFDAKTVQKERDEKGKLELQLKKQFGPLMNWLKVNFNQVFSAWVHLKALRVFTESVLRYSLPVNFQAVIMKPHRKSQKKLTEILNGLYGHLDSNYIASEAEMLDMQGLSFGQQDYHPYVFFEIDLNLLAK